MRDTAWIPAKDARIDANIKQSQRIRAQSVAQREASDRLIAHSHQLTRQAQAQLAAHTEASGDATDDRMR